MGQRERVRLAVSVLALAVALPLVPALPARTSPSQPTVPRVVIEHYTPGVIDLAGKRYVMVLGTLVNQGPGPAEAIFVSLTARREPGGEVIGIGGGESWLQALNAGESGPFSVAIGHCCPEDIGDYDFSITAAPAPADRYLDLEITGQVPREVNGGRWIYGDLVNTGDAFLNATETDVFMGFWRGEDLVRLDTARMPILRGISEPTGQSHPPGWRYPWAVQVPDLVYDRTEVWSYAEAYPPDVYPVPLGAEDVASSRDGSDIRVAATVTNCGLAPSESLLVMVVARDAADRVLEFGLAQPRLAAPIRRGDRVPINLVWPNAREEIKPEGVSLWPLSLETQAKRPAEMPCPLQMPAIYLPAAMMRWERP